MECMKTKVTTNVKIGMEDVKNVMEEATNNVTGVNMVITSMEIPAKRVVRQEHGKIKEAENAINVTHHAPNVTGLMIMTALLALSQK